MTLNKRYIRNVKENRSFYIASSVLTIVTLLLFYLFYIAGSGIKDYGDRFFERNNLEDASFTTYIEIPDEKIKNIEKKYDVIFEKEHYVNISENDYNVRVFKANKKIDLYEVVDGGDVVNDDEIVISKGYAINQNINLGDKIKIAGKEYKVTGYFMRPDYLYMLENIDDSYKNISSFFLAYMTDSAYDKLNTSSCQYKVIYKDEDKITDFRKAMNKEYKVSSYKAKSENNRITMVDDQANMFIVMSFVFLFILPLITVALISIIIGRKVKNEQKMIGTLAALGYKKEQIIRHYAMLAMIPGVIGGVLVAVITKILQQPYGEVGLADYEPMPVKFSLPLWIAVLGVIIPTVFYIMAAACKVRKLLKKDIVTLLNGNSDGNAKMRKVMVNSATKVRTKFALRSILSNPGRSFVVFLGSFLGAFIIIIAFMFVDSIKNLVNTTSDNMGTFKYEYVLNSLESEKIDDADELVMGNFEYKDSSFTLLGAEDDVKFLNITLDDKEKAKLDKGFYISEVMAYAYNLKKGDTIEFIDGISLDKHSVVIDGIITNNSQKLLVCGIDDAREIMGWDDNVYNGVLSDEKLDFGDKVSKTVTSDDIKEQMQTVMDEMGAIIYSLAIIGGIICIASLYVAVNMLITENRHNISMLKVLGLKNREINRMVLDVNHGIIPIGTILGMLAGYVCMILVFKIYSGIEGVMYSGVVSIKSVILTIVIVLLCYFISLVIMRKKAENVDMVESLKDNRE